MVNERFRLPSRRWHSEDLQEPHNSPSTPSRNNEVLNTHLSENLLGQPPPLRFVEPLIKAQNTPTTLETISSHLELIHRMHILNMHFYTGSVRRFGSPEVQIFMSSRLKIQRVIAIVQICELWDQVEVVFGVQLRICRSQK